MSFSFMAAVTIHSDAQENKICHCFHFFSSICHEVIGPDTMILVFFFFFYVLFYLFIYLLDMQHVAS